MKAIVYAMRKEVAAPFEGGTPLDNSAGLTLRKLSGDLMVCVCGIGKVNTALAVQHLIDCHGVTEVWNAGVSGCFLPLPAGTLVAVTSCVQHDLDMFGDPQGTVPVLDMVHLPCTDPDATLARLTAAGYDCRPGVVASGRTLTGPPTSGTPSAPWCATWRPLPPPTCACAARCPSAA